MIGGRPEERCIFTLYVFHIDCMGNVSYRLMGYFMFSSRSLLGSEKMVVGVTASTYSYGEHPEQRVRITMPPPAEKAVSSCEPSLCRL
jgi:hypothetical protein